MKRQENVWNVWQIEGPSEERLGTLKEGKEQADRKQQRVWRKKGDNVHLCLLFQH